MKPRIKAGAIVLSFLITVLLLTGCSQSKNGKQASSGGFTGSGGKSSQTEIVGKVTSIVGNQVVLALGTLNDSTQKGENAAAGKSQSGAGSSVSSGAASESSGTGSGSSSGEITLTGETKTLLIPVGLTLSDKNSRSGAVSQRASGNAQGGQAGGFSGGASGNSGGQRSGGSGFTAGGGFGGAGNSLGTRTNSASGSTGAVAGTLTQRSKDFSSITKGMILRITQAKLSDGTEGIVRVTVVSG